MEDKVIIWQKEDGTLVTGPADPNSVPGEWIAMSAPMALGVAMQQIEAMGGGAAGSFQDSAITAPGGPVAAGTTDWASAESQRASDRANAAIASRQSGYGSSDPTSPFNQNQGQATQGGPGGGWQYGGPIDPGGTKPTGYVDVPDTLPSGALAYQPDTSGRYTPDVNGGPGGVGGSSTRSGVATGNYGGWMSGLGAQDPLDLLDKKYGTELYLGATGQEKNANKEMFQDIYGGYGNLSEMANGGQSLTTEQIAQQAGDFIGGLTGGAGGDFIDSRAMWDKQFGAGEGSYGEGLNASTSQSATAGKDQYDKVMANIQAMSQFMGPGNVKTAMNMVDQAYFDYKSGGDAIAGQKTFIDYLREQGADTWF